MRVCDVRKKYPEFFVTVESSAWDDMRDIMKKYFVTAKICRRIAYNAAAVATLELHKIITAKK